MIRPAPLLLILTLALTIPCRTQQEPTAAEVLQNIRARFDRVRDYSADISADVKFEKMRIPRMEATVYFKQPDRIHIEPKEGAFAMFPKDAVAFNPSELIGDRYDMVLQGQEEVAGTRCLKLKLLARSDTIRLQRLMLYVDPQFWVIRKLDATPERGGDVAILFEHQIFQNTHVMPARITVTMDTPMPGRRPQPQQGTQAGETRKGSVIVTYSNYRINQGIPDARFQTEKEKRP